MIIETRTMPTIQVMHNDDGPSFRLTFESGSMPVHPDAIQRTEPLNPREIALIVRALSAQWRNS